MGANRIARGRRFPRSFPCATAISTSEFASAWPRQPHPWQPFRNTAQWRIRCSGGCRTPRRSGWRPNSPLVPGTGPGRNSPVRRDNRPHQWVRKFSGGSPIGLGSHKPPPGPTSIRGFARAAMPTACAENKPALRSPPKMRSEMRRHLLIATAHATQPRPTFRTRSESFR